ncbi:unnamed protein product [Protopolystoma xenopodis]|uniref:Symplekin/Pta1 N-terminal domain-containing protein n=1 Tax=Protopolystoma xenopodis TaxID=117903 RepID=A0A3S5CUE3_9PLAT|nr:unnamed protein product [Protopolystoma xenopodis]
MPLSEIPLEREADISLDQVPELTGAQLQEVLSRSSAASASGLLPGVCLVRPRRLADEADRLMAGLLDGPVSGRADSASTAAVNGVTRQTVVSRQVTAPLLDAVLESLVNIACQRPQFMDKTLQAFETVHGTSFFGGYGVEAGQ